MCQKRDSLNFLRVQIDGLTKALAAVMAEPDPPPMLPRSVPPPASAPPRQRTTAHAGD